MTYGKILIYGELKKIILLNINRKYINLYKLGEILEEDHTSMY